MNKRALRVLEFDKIIERLSAKAVSSLGREHIDALMPSSEYKDIVESQKETSEAFAMILHHSNPPFGAIYDLSEAVKRAEIGGALYPGTLLQIGDTLRTIRRMRNYIIKKEDAEETYPILFDIAMRMESLKDIEEMIEHAVMNDQDLYDHASSELKKLRRSIENKHVQVRNKLDSIISSQSNAMYLQDALVTIRNDRFVVPVKSEHKNAIKGLVHDQSSSGSTFYVEPLAVVELNNELRELKLAERKEFERILLEMSGRIGLHANTIRASLNLIGRLDFIFAKAKLSFDMKGIEPTLTTDYTFHIKNGRHPMLSDDEVVPSNIWIGEGFGQLLITGPNTGGKTVTLKTVGLLTLMAQSGLHVPADHGTKMAVYEEVFADIGDEQSIEQSLSTFSSHMTNIVDILSKVSPMDLVLFDELGAGTDPTEGAALAMSILNKLHKLGTKTLATTHYSELKEYAILTDGVENASVEFDITTLSPTYKLLIGIPGKSNAFDISRKLGLDEDTINSAKHYVHRDNIQFEDLLSNIEASRKEAENERDEAKRMKVEVERLQAKLEEKEKRLEEQKEKAISKAKAEARTILKRAKAESEAIIKDLRDAEKKAKKFGLSDVDGARSRMKNALKDVQDETIKKDVVNNDAPKDLKIGDTVKVITINQEGTVISKPDAQGNLQIQVGIMKMQVNVKHLVKQDEKKRDEQTLKRVRESKLTRSVSREIDVRGMNVEEAMMDIEKFIDDAIVGNLDKVHVIHGKGTGALRAGLLERFKRHRNVKKFYHGDFSEGGNGMTVLELR